MTAPILLIFFNRPDTLQIVFEQIRRRKPEKLYLFQDGQRENCSDDAQRIKECRKIVSNIDWPCEVKTNFQTINNGCGKGPKKAIDRLFENEEEGIVLEDDCVASQSFFTFCTELLAKYKYDERIFLISGCNFMLKSPEIASSYFFGFSGTNWGWATWKRNWIKMQYDCSWVLNTQLCESVKERIKSVSRIAANREINQFKETNKLVNSNVKLSYWDIQWQSIRHLNNQLSIIPSVNLITNIGLGPTSTHATDSKIPSKLNDKIGKINFCYNVRYDFENELIHPEYITQNYAYDKKIYNELYPSRLLMIFKKILRKVGINK